MVRRKSHGSHAGVASFYDIMSCIKITTAIMQFKMLRIFTGIFAPYKLKDDFRRIEYQMRGSPHSHGLYWIEDAPEYDENDPTSVVRCREFIDNFITVEKCQEGPMEQLIKMQTHSHSSTCKYKEGKRDCRFGYPLPPIPETTILEPLPKDTSKASRKRHLTTFKTIQEELTGRTKNNDTDIGFDEFLTILGVTKENYVMGKCIKLP